MTEYVVLRVRVEGLPEHLCKLLGNGVVFLPLYYLSFRLLG